MKNLTTCWVAGLLAGSLLLAACGGTETTAAPEPTPSEVAPTAVPTTPPAPMPEPTATPEPEPTATPEPTAAPEPTATPEPTAIPDPTATPEPTESTESEQTEATPTPTSEAVADEPTPAAEPTVEATETDDAGVAGQTIFASRCSVCHGPGGNGSNQGPPLTGIGQFFPDDASPLFGLVTNGGTNMPEFGSKLTADEIQAVVEYVVTTFQ